jgi:bacteriocin-like protein
MNHDEKKLNASQDLTATTAVELSDKDLQQVAGGTTSSPQFYEACCNGKHIPAVVIE